MAEPLVIGLGAMRGVQAEEVLAAVDAVLPVGVVVRALATLDLRATEPGIRAAAADRGWDLIGHPAATLAGVPVPAPSAAVAAAVGTPSVAEAAALFGGGALVLGKTVHGRVTVALALVSANQLRSAHTEDAALDRPQASSLDRYPTQSCPESSGDSGHDCPQDNASSHSCPESSGDSGHDCPQDNSSSHSCPESSGDSGHDCLLDSR